jgi:hypothetical protein
LFYPQIFQKSLSSSSIKRWSIVTKRERKKHSQKDKESSKKSLSFEKGEFNIFKTFPGESISSPSILPFQKPFSKSFGNS